MRGGGAATRGGSGLAEGEDGDRDVELGCVRKPRLGRRSARTTAVGMRFGLPLFGTAATIVEPTTISLGAGRIVLLIGPSGSGKSSALEQIDRQFAGGAKVDRVRFPADVAIVDGVAPGASLGEAISILTACGMGEPRLWVRRFDELSEGEQFRSKLARAAALQAQGGGVAPLLCDEFCSGLHRRAAKTISYNLRKLVARRNLSVVLACSNEDIISDLRPDTILWLGGAGRCRVEHRRVGARRPVSLRRRMKIEPGTKRDYEAFAAMHYRATDELGFVDKIFVLREGRGGDAVGIVVYAYGPLGLSLRNQATGGIFDRDPKRLNRRLRILRRLVMHPDLRGCGLGHYLVQKTLPLLGVDYVECLASMGEFNPVFEKAGMKRVGQYDLSPKQIAALDALRALDVDPNGRDLVLQVCRRRRVREIVSGVVYDWYAATTAGAEYRVERQSPEVLAQTFRGLIGSRPVYYLWERGNAARDSYAG